MKLSNFREAWNKWKFCSDGFGVSRSRIWAIEIFFKLATNDAALNANKLSIVSKNTTKLKWNFVKCCVEPCHKYPRNLTSFPLSHGGLTKIPTKWVNFTCDSMWNKLNRTITLRCACANSSPSVYNYSNIEIAFFVVIMCSSISDYML